MEKHIYFTYGDRGSVPQFNIVDNDEFQLVIENYSIDTDNVKDIDGFWGFEGILHYGKIILEDYIYLIFVDPEAKVSQHIYYTDSNPYGFVYDKFIRETEDIDSDDDDEETTSFKNTILDNKPIETLNMNKLYDCNFNYSTGDYGVHVVNTSEPYPKSMSEWEMDGQQHSAVIFIHKLK